MKYLFHVFIVLASISGIWSQYESSEEDNDARGDGYVSPPMILKLIEQSLDSLDHFRNNELRYASEEVNKFFKEFDYKKIYTEKIDQLRVQFQKELQTNSNQACNQVFDEMTVKLNKVLLELPERIDDALFMLTSAVDLMEKKLRRMIERVNRYSAEAGDCRVADNAQCELLAKYYEDLTEVRQGNIRFLVKELAELSNNLSPAGVAEEATQLVFDKIEKPVRSCLSRST